MLVLVYLLTSARSEQFLSLLLLSVSLLLLLLSLSLIIIISRTIITTDNDYDIVRYFEALLTSDNNNNNNNNTVSAGFVAGPSRDFFLSEFTDQ